MQISKRLVLLNSASSATVMVVNLGVLIWLQPYLLARISKEEYSLLPIVVAVTAFIPLLTEILSAGVGQFVTVAHARNDLERVTRVTSSAFPIFLLGAVVLAVLGVLAVQYLPDLVQIPASEEDKCRLMLGLLWIVPISGLLVAPFTSGFVVTNKLVYSDMISLGAQVLRLALLLILIVGVRATVVWVVVAQVTSSIVQQLVALPFSRRLVPSLRFERGLFDPKLVKEILSYGVWSVVSRVAGVLKVSMDPLLLTSFRGWTASERATQVSGFHVGGIAPRQVGYAMQPLVQPLIPVFAILFAQGDIEKCRRAVHRSCRYTGWAAGLFCAPVIVLGHELMGLYLHGTNVDAELLGIAGHVVVILSAALVLQATFLPFGVYAGASARLRPWGIVQIVIQGGNLCLTVVLVLLLGYGAIGAVSATLTTAILLEPPLVMWYARHVLGGRVRDIFRGVLLPVATPFVAALGVSSAGALLISVDSWLALMSVAASAAVVHLAVVLLISARHDDRQDLAEFFERLRGRWRRSDRS